MSTCSLLNYETVHVAISNTYVHIRIYKGCFDFNLWRYAICCMDICNLCTYTHIFTHTAHIHLYIHTHNAQYMRVHK